MADDEQEILETSPSLSFPVYRGLARVLTAAVVIATPFVVDQFDLASNLHTPQALIPLVAVVITSAVCGAYNSSLSVVVRESGKNMSEFAMHFVGMQTVALITHFLYTNYGANLSGM